MTVEYDRGELAGVIAEAITNHLMLKIRPATAAGIRAVLEESGRLSAMTSATLHPEFQTYPAECIKLFQQGGQETTNQVIKVAMRPRGLAP
ncbi:hypothetical protein [Pseudomonas putida]